MWFVVCLLLCKKKKLFRIKNPQSTGQSFRTCIMLGMLFSGRKVQLARDHFINCGNKTHGMSSESRSIELKLKQIWGLC